MSTLRYVIIGNSAAAVGCVEAIREADGAGPITLVSAEPHHSYSRPLISYLLAGKTTRDKMRYRPLSFYKDHGCEALLGVRAEGINAAAGEVFLEDGRRLPYDRLLVATGSLPFVPPMAGLEGVEKRFTFLSLSDALALEAALTPSSRVLIVGAGLIGLKCAEGLCGRVADITVVDLADRVLSSVLDEGAAALVAGHIAARGVKLRLGTSVDRFESVSATLKTGERVDFDILVLAVGVKPNDALVREAGGEADRGVVTDLSCAASLPGVYAAGDCAQCLDTATGRRRVLALLPGAHMQGRCAGLNMAGKQARYDTAIPMNALGLWGLHMITAGSYEGECIDLSEGENYKKLFVQDNLLKGYMMLGNVERAGIYTALVRERTPLDSIDFELIKKRPQLMAFSQRERVRKLGGAP